METGKKRAQPDSESQNMDLPRLGSRYRDDAQHDETNLKLFIESELRVSHGLATRLPKIRAMPGDRSGGGGVTAPVTPGRPAAGPPACHAAGDRHCHGRRLRIVQLSLNSHDCPAVTP